MTNCPLGQKCALVEEEAAIAFMDQARSPRLRSPRGVEIFLQEERQLVRIGHGNDLHVAALVVGLHAVVLEPLRRATSCVLPNCGEATRLP